MAATDKTYYNQHKLDIWFGLTSVVMLVSVVIMMAQDYFRPFKDEQRAFRKVESAVAQRLAMADIPDEEKFQALEAALAQAQKQRNTQQGQIDKIKAQMQQLQPKKESSDAAFGAATARLDSKVSFFNIEAEHHGFDAANKEYGKEIENLRAEKAAAKAAADEQVEKLRALQHELNDIEEPVTKAQAAWKKVNDSFEAQAKLAISKRWGWGDTFRKLPMMDAFNPSVKIQQITIEDVPINFNFKQVTRFDSCTTCHQAIDRPDFTKEMIQSLTRVSKEQQEHLNAARKRLEQRLTTLAGTVEEQHVPKAGELDLTTLSATELTPARVKEFSAHPRLDLFVGADSKHPMEKFGCTACHEGEGRGTTFTGAFHSPNDSTTAEEWTKTHGWDPTDHTYLWDFPMHPSRFVESSCLKCHYQVTDLYGADNRNEAPKLLRGYNLIKDLGCFGCHEFQGRKGGRQVGPDLRLESKPPLDELSPIERARIEQDPDNMPGNLRKVGPSLYRVADKTNREWAAKFIKSPHSFRPDTKMPHYYGQPNNDADALAGTGQELFPDAEIQTIVYYLFEASNKYIQTLPARSSITLTDQQQAVSRLHELQSLSKLSKEQKDELAEVRGKLERMKSPKLEDLVPKGYKARPEVGRQLFSEHGCLACHRHVGTEKPQGDPADATYAPKVVSEAQFGPNLSQLTAKFGSSPAEKDAARLWLVQWILDPHVHSPRSRMPVTHATVEQAADIAAWLLSQPAAELGKDWQNILFTLPAGDEELKKTLDQLATVYLKRMLPDKYIAELLANQWQGTQDVQKKNTIRDLPEDEVNLTTIKKGDDLEVKEITLPDLKYYLGKKAIGRMGCFACHDIPGFDTTKNIGTGLMDWGKKDPGRLAFEDIDRYLDKHYYFVPTPRGESSSPAGSDKKPYEAFFADLIKHRKREGYLFQKLNEPRSYDYRRLLAWDDRSRMPKFQFARGRKMEDETDEQFRDRMFVEEAQAREAVMTFVLGLVAEPVPFKSINQPRGDRLDVVMGRQVIDKFNCAGCHLVQPGVFEFNVGPQTGKLLERTYQNRGKEHSFPEHSDWTGQTPTSKKRLTAQGTLNPLLLFEYRDPESLEMADDPADASNLKTVHVRLSRALRFANAGEHDILSSNTIDVATTDMIYPPPEAIGSEDAFKKFVRDQGPLGGTFNDLLMNYLIAKYRRDDTLSKVFARDPNTRESSNAHASGPPSLIGEGERTQSAWLEQFLLDPQPIRPMAKLRMPRFNMSPAEARALVAYFGAAARTANPGIDISGQAVPQEERFDSEIWTKKTKQYLDRLGDKGREQRRKELQPFFDGNLDGYLNAAKTVEEKQAVKRVISSREWKTWVVENEGRTPQDREHDWEKQAYVADAYKLAAKVCTECHQVGKLPPSNSMTSGPPLLEAHQRLRPGWVEHWVASPQRFLPYGSVMPVNFPADRNDQYQDLLAGSSLDQVRGVRDAVMTLPRMEALPINRFRQLTMPLKPPAP